MEKINNTYSDIAHIGSGIKEKLASAIRENFAIIVLVINIIFKISLELFDARVENPFNIDFFIKLGTDIATTMFCYCCFISYGHKMEKVAMSGYKENCKRWSALSATVRNNMSALFTDFCRTCVDEEREERRRAIIINHTMLTWESFCNDWRGKSKKYVKRAAKNGDITKRDEYYINRANGIIKIKPINPILILCGVKISSLNDAGRDRLNPSTISALSRPVSMFILSACTEMLHGAWRGVSTGEEIYNMIFSVLMIIIASVMGYSAGVNSARKEHDKIKGRIFFIEKFLERHSA